MEFQFDEFFAFLRGRGPFPFSDRVHGGFGQYRVSADYVGGLQSSVGGNDCLYFYRAAYLHAAREVWIGGHYPIRYFSIEWLLVLSAGGYRCYGNCY